MPSSEEILAGLSRIAADHAGWAIAWHVVMLVAIVAIWRTRRIPTLAIAAPIASAAIFAGIGENPFNLVLLGIVSIAVLAMHSPTRRGLTDDFAGLGAALLLYAWLYPAFAGVRALSLSTLYSSPVGIVPCPSLALAIGLALLTRPRRGDAVLAAAGLFYAMFGIGYLGVWLDLPLLAGATGLLLRARRDLPRLAHRFPG